MKSIGIIGQGVIGLTTGITLLKNGFECCIYTHKPLEQTTSLGAGSFWWPYKAEPQEKIVQWAKRSFEIYKTYAQIPESGVSFKKYLRFCDTFDDSKIFLALTDGWSEIDSKKFGINSVQSFETCVPMMDASVFMPFLVDTFQKLGGKIIYQEVEDLDKFACKFDAVVNCPGVWARNDKETFPIRGQVVSVAIPDGLPNTIYTQFHGDDFTLIIPRIYDCILGGTAQKDDWSIVPCEQTTATIVERCLKIEPLLKNAKILGTKVALRPGRGQVRLEKAYSSSGITIVHNYGHAGAGFTLAWGCAEEVLSHLI